MSAVDGFGCPLPAGDGGVVRLAHGGGGRATEQLLERVFRPAFDDPALAEAHDGAVLDLDGPIALSTDSYVVRPLFFPGGDIGRLAVCGTVNDLAMCGARPVALSAGFILEEGLPLATLDAVVHSMAATARAIGVRVATGDLKVVERGRGDGVYINTSGVGCVVATSRVSPAAVRPGDALVLSGDVGRHGVAVMDARESLGFEPPLVSDAAPLAAPVLNLLASGVPVHCLRDLTRGGLAGGLVEIAERAGVAMTIDESAVAVAPGVAAACELLGLDPLQVANEGRFLAVVPAESADAALRVLRRHPVSADAEIIGHVETPGDDGATVRARGPVGGMRVIDRLSGEQLPRIC